MSGGAPETPLLTVDLVIEVGNEIVFIERKHPPLGFALPGGFVDRGETVEAAAIREAGEETGLAVELEALLGVYSDPDRDPRGHTASVAYVARAEGPPAAGDDAATVLTAPVHSPPSPLCFDHARILADYQRFRATGERPRPRPRFDPTAPSGERPHLDAMERATLLAVAGDALEAAVGGRPPRRIAGEDRGHLAEPGACFVTLRERGHLRGCIGTLEARIPLAEETRAMTAAAALRDPRFPPVSVEELPSLALSLSVLSPMRTITDVAEIEVGRHGIAIERPPHRGVLLPQVAVELGWDRQTFLAQTCAKAGLPADAWRDPGTQIEIFEADVFGDGS